MKINIKTTNIKLKPSIQEYIYEKIGSLDKFLVGKNKEIVEIKVDIGKTTEHHQKGNIFRAGISFNLLGQQIRSEAEAWDLKIAINKVKDDLQRELKKYKKKQASKYKRGARKAKKLLQFSPLALFKRKKGDREKEEGI